MNAIRIDSQTKERSFMNLTLSDSNVVKQLILHRSKVDITYNANVNGDIYKSNDIYGINQELIALYVSLDAVIKKCNFKAKQIKFLELLFKGNTIRDICSLEDNDFNVVISAYKMLNRIVEKIVKTNNDSCGSFIKNKL